MEGEEKKKGGQGGTDGCPKRRVKKGEIGGGEIDEILRSNNG